MAERQLQVVTGAFGYTGQAIARRLLEQGDQVPVRPVVDDHAEPAAALGEKPRAKAPASEGTLHRPAAANRRLIPKVRSQKSRPKPPAGLQGIRLLNMSWPTPLCWLQ